LSNKNIYIEIIDVKHNKTITLINNTFLLFFMDALTLVSSNIQIEIFNRVKKINTEPIKGSVNKIVL